jgi:hypothetical protein
MSVFMLSRSILLMHMRAGHQMSNAYTLKEGAKLVILALLVSLDGQYFSIEETRRSTWTWKS